MAHSVVSRRLCEVERCGSVEVVKTIELLKPEDVECVKLVFADMVLGDSKMVEFLWGPATMLSTEDVRLANRLEVDMSEEFELIDVVGETVMMILEGVVSVGLVDELFEDPYWTPVWFPGGTVRLVPGCPSPQLWLSAGVPCAWSPLSNSRSK